MDVVPSTIEPVVALEANNKVVANDKAVAKAFRLEISSQDSRKFLDNNHLQTAIVEEIHGWTV
ncbi:UNVERIFIED_CONTAM: hypothetical protein Sradi_5107600 [Sesamum radiatum]|uniref:Uncharacterized protein n=1 Tax=Sesamum radiatum TaxID=300843 RepID=A0AAW2M318_SESRA